MYLYQVLAFRQDWHTYHLSGLDALFKRQREVLPHGRLYEQTQPLQI